MKIWLTYNDEEFVCQTKFLLFFCHKGRTKLIAKEPVKLKLNLFNNGLTKTIV